MSSVESNERHDAYIPEKAEAIVTALGRGVPFRWACETLGLTEQTGHNWRKAHPEFDTAVRAARAGKVSDYYSTIIRAAEQGDTKTARWLVEKAESQYHDDAGSGAGAATAPTHAPVIPFRGFAREGWTHIDPAQLVWSWHLDEWCDALEDAAKRRRAGEAVRLVIEGPPGATKSRPVSILWQPWVWTWWPESEWITTSWDESLALDLSGFARDLVLSPWYQTRWPLDLVKDGAGDWGNALGGRRLARGLKSRVTGDHAQFLVLDDPVKEQLTRIGTPYQIAQAVGGACGIWFGTYGTRAIDHVGCYVIAMQGLHVDDPGAVGVREKGYERISFPWHFDPSKADPRDHRTVAGESLCSRLTEEKYEALRLDIGPTATAAQCEQDRQPPGGQILKAEYMANRWDTLPAELQDDVLSGRAGIGRKWKIFGDLSFKSKRQARGRRTPDYVVFELWCAVGARRYLVDEVRGIWGYREAKAQLGAFALRHQQAVEIRIEDAANAAALEDDVRGDLLEEGDLISALLQADAEEGKPLGPPPAWASYVILEPVSGGTLARTQAVEGVWASGAVWLPENERWVDGKDGFVEEHTRYVGDGTDTDDRVSVSSLALLHFKTACTDPAWVRAAQAQIARQQAKRR